MRTSLLLSAVLLGVAFTASAQVGAPLCSVSVPVVPFLFNSSTSAAVGNLLLDCTGGSPVANGLLLPQIDFNVFFNAPILVTPEPRLAISDPLAPATNVLLCSSLSGCATVASSTPYDGLPGDPNLFRGSASGNQVSFLGVPFDPPGSGHLMLEMENISINPSLFQEGYIVQAFVVATGASAPTISGPLQEVGVVTPEPSTLWLSVVVVAGLMARRKRR